MRKKRIMLLSDSTVQSYDRYYYPQTGWGQVIYENFTGAEKVKEEELVTCSYPQSRKYEFEDFIIENRAIGGRSSRSFIEEGKFEEALNEMECGDYVFIQFGHNDATVNRPERYVAAENFEEYLEMYINECEKKGAKVVFVTPVARRNCDDTESFKISFDEYRQVMIKTAQKKDVPLLDLGKISIDYLNSVGNEESKKLYLYTKKGEYEGAYAEGVCDNTHLSFYGAGIYAKMVCDLIKMDERLKDLKKYLK